MGRRRLLVKQYVPEIMKAVVALPEQQVCGAVGLCDTSSMTGVPLSPRVIVPCEAWNGFKISSCSVCAACQVCVFNNTE